MMWVKLTLAPVVRANWLLRMSRFTSRRRAGTERTLVAVGTPRLASMFATMRDAAPRRTVASSFPVCPSGAGAGITAAGACGAVVAAAGTAATATPGAAASPQAAWLWGIGTGAGR